MAAEDANALPAESLTSPPTGKHLDGPTSRRESLDDWWEKVTAPIGAGDGTVPLFNYVVSKGSDEERNAWRWQDWDGDALIIDEHGCAVIESECFVQLSHQQLAEIAVVAAHLVPIVKTMRSRDEFESGVVDDQH